MNLEALLERTEILLKQNVITQKAYDVSIQAFKNLQTFIGKSYIEHAEMLFTHLPMAITRISSGGDVTGPDNLILEEIKNSPYFGEAETQVAMIEKNLGEPLPTGEKNYLMLHFVNVIQQNLEGGENE